VASTTQLFRLLNEVIFLMLGALLVWVALTGRYYFDPSGAAWLLLAGLLVGYGVVAMVWSAGSRAIAIVRGGSLIVVGLVMLSLARVTLRWVEPMLMTAGVTLGVRGIIVSALVMRTSPSSPVKSR
jgi:hypothetical protein